MSDSNILIKIGTVQSIDGDVEAIDVEGNVRVLKEGDPIFLSDVIVTADGSDISIGLDAFTDQQSDPIIISEKSRLLISEDTVPGINNAIDLIDENAVDIPSLQKAVLNGDFEVANENESDLIVDEFT
jgi:hypothetical protein